jgi:hypothetical protein
VFLVMAKNFECQLFLRLYFLRIPLHVTQAEVQSRISTSLPRRESLGYTSRFRGLDAFSHCIHFTWSFGTSSCRTAGDGRGYSSSPLLVWFGLVWFGLVGTLTILSRRGFACGFELSLRLGSAQPQPQAHQAPLFLLSCSFPPLTVLPSSYLLPSLSLPPFCYLLPSVYVPNLSRVESSWAELGHATEAISGLLRAPLRTLRHLLFFSQNQNCDILKMWDY